MNLPLAMLLLLPSDVLYYRSPWGSLIQRAGHCVCDQSDNSSALLRIKSVLNAHKEKQSCNINRHTVTHSWVFRESRLTMRQVQAENVLCFFFVFFSSEWNIVLTVTARTLLAQLYTGFTEIQSLFTQPLCHIEIKHTTMPRHPGVLFMERTQSQMTALLQPTAAAEES